MLSPHLEATSGVHPTAQVAATACLHPDSEVGPFCVVGPQVTLEAGCRLLGHVVVSGATHLGANCIVHPFAVLGGPPQIGGAPQGDGRLYVGAGCVLREGVTLSLGSRGGRGETRLGPGCLLMAHAHVGHDGLLEAGVVLANNVLLGGHTHIGAQAQVGGGAAIHQHCRVGRLAFVGGGAMVAEDIPPFTVAQGDRACLAGLNVVGLRRAGVSATARQALWRAYSTLFGGDRPLQEARAWLAQTTAGAHAEVDTLCAFVAPSRRGIARRRRRQTDGPSGPAQGEAAGKTGVASAGERDAG